MTDLETTIATAKAREVEHVRRVQAQIAELAPYAEAVHPIPKHPEPGCSCHGCERRDAWREEQGENKAAEPDDRWTVGTGRHHYDGTGR